MEAFGRDFMMAAVVRSEVPRGDLSGLAYRGRAGGGGSNAPVVYDLWGSIVGADLDRYIADRVASGSRKVVDAGYARNRMQEAR